MPIILCQTPPSKGDVKAVVISDDEFRGKEKDAAFKRFLKVLENNGIEIING
jgi:hypothetical protein